jgi:hypothetical protein
MVCGNLLQLAEFARLSTHCPKKWLASRVLARRSAIEESPGTMWTTATHAKKEVAPTLNIRRPNPAPRIGLASFEGRRCPTPKAQLRQSAQAGRLPLRCRREAAGRRNYPEAVPTTISGHAATTTNFFISVFSLFLIFPDWSCSRRSYSCRCRRS